MLKFINDIKKNRIFKIYNKMRQVYLKKFICNMGKIVEKDDKIICYVDQKSIDKYKIENNPCRLRLYGMEQISEKEKRYYRFF